MSVPKDCNVWIKEMEKRSKYKDLEIEICRMWQMKVTNIPVIVDALGFIRKGMEDNIKKIPGQTKIKFQCNY
jgi:hypothetical protein